MRPSSTGDRHPWLWVACSLTVIVAGAVSSVAGTGPGPMDMEGDGLLLGDRLTPDDADEPVDGNPSHAFTFFGSSMDADGDTLAVGTAYDPGDSHDWVYVFEQSQSGTWEQVTKLVPSDADEQPYSGFGVSVAVDETPGTLVVGDPGYDIPSEQNVGAVYIFQRSPVTGWTEVAKFVGPDPPGEGHLPRFGWSVDIDGTTVAVGAPRVPGGGPNGTVEGTVTVLEKDNGGWRRDTVLGPYSDQSHDHLGYSVGLADETIVAGSSWGRPASGDLIGSVASFEHDSEEWSLEETLWPPLMNEAGSPNAVFGFSLDIARETLVVGDPGWGSTPGSGTTSGLLGVGKISTLTGQAYVFDQAERSWSLSGILTPPTPQPFMAFGDSVAVSDDGSNIVVGADHFVEAKTPPAGTAYLFQRPVDGPWSLTRQLTGHDTGPGDWFGEASTITETTAFVGAPFDDNRGDGTTFPFSDQGTMPDPVCQQVGCSGPNDGSDAGSVYTFEIPGESNDAEMG